MQNFRNILFASNKGEVGLECLKKLLILTAHNKASLKILILYSPFPDDFTKSKSDYEQYLTDKIKLQLESACNDLKISKNELEYNILAEEADSPAVRIIQHVLRYSHDLVVKQSEEPIQNNGFKSLDMELLRKCPCPVFIERPSKLPVDKLKVAVAIDVEKEGIVRHDLAVQLLQLARGFADIYNADLSIISCWFYEYEAELSEGAWYEISKDALAKIVNDYKEMHKAKFEKLLLDSKIGGVYETHLLKGNPDTEIPTYVEKNNIDTIIMGTVARTGLQSIFIGNTAENVLQQLKCSLLAKKPNGFVSPIKAY